MSLFSELNLPINPLDLLQISRRQPCPKCSKMSHWYCSSCGIPVTIPKIDVPSLPIPLTTLFYPGENLKKSSVQLVNALQIENFNVDIIDFQKKPEDGSILLFPSEDAVELSSINLKETKHIYVLDCTWPQAYKCIQSNFLLNIQKVKICNHKTEFWRPHGKGENSSYLSTCECIYWLNKEISSLLELNQNYDGIMTLFVAQACLVKQQMYQQGRVVIALGRKGEKQYGGWLDLEKSLKDKYETNDSH
ncbi:DTW domain-containing protein [Spironucleus salmonicida]|uniref:tRNA-uridine aminocarboxypropyltransferase 1 n=1 Tax=Spironucleus salmonicida TaxID=348837 RepID=V6LKG8_9EUKA|nr:DTW domain-containing protein [Spironucleus salmonicida]|eukprot:EST45062.1 hypothetical protein SS50377_15083 [Spironucleus salmonicida]